MQVHSLSRRIVLVTLLALVPAVVVVLWTVVFLHDARTQEIHAEALGNAELAYQEMERVLGGAEGVLRVIAQAPVVAAHNTDSCAEFVGRVLRALPYLASITISDPDGSVWCLPDPTESPLYIGDRPYFQDALRSSDLITGLFTVDRATGRNVLPIALRLGGSDGRVLGVVAAYPDLGWFQSIIEQRALPPGDSITIADREGRILARVPEPDRFVGTVIPDDFQRLVRASLPGSEELISQDGTKRIIGYYPPAYGKGDIYVSTGTSYDPAFALVNVAATSGLLILLVGAVAAGFLTAYTSRAYIVRPFNRLSETVEAWRSNDTEPRSLLTKEDGEIGTLGMLLDSFMDELVASRAARRKAEDQRVLMALELNHRVKNLLTLIDVVARKTFSDLDAKDEIRTFSARLHSIAAANDLLLEGNSHATSLRQVVEASTKPFHEGHSAQFQIEGPDLELPSGSTVALGMALHELCTNAAKYGALSTKEGRVSIKWSATAREDGPGFELLWQETGGPPVSPPKRTGFGSVIVQRALEQSIKGRVEVSFDRTGFSCRINAPLT